MSEHGAEKDALLSDLEMLARDWAHSGHPVLKEVAATALRVLIARHQSEATRAIPHEVNQ